MPFHQKLKNISHLSALWNDDVDLGLVVGADRNIFNLPHDEQTVDNATKDDVFPIQELALCTGDEELAAVWILTWLKNF